MKKLTAIRKAYSKSQILGRISEETGLTRKNASEMMDSLFNIIHAHLRKGATGEFSLPGLAKFRVVHKPATKARKGINPFTGEMTTFKAKPARNLVKIRALKMFFVLLVNIIPYKA